MSCINDVYTLSATRDNAIVVNHDKFTVINYAFCSISFSVSRECYIPVSLLITRYTRFLSFSSLHLSLSLLYSSPDSPVFPLLSTNNRRTARFVVARSDLSPPLYSSLKSTQALPSNKPRRILKGAASFESLQMLT